MDQPLGLTIGNASETAEALQILRGLAPPDVTELTRTLGAMMLVLAGVARERHEADARMDTALGSGLALQRAEAMIQAQGGDPRVTVDPGILPRAPVETKATADRKGYVTEIDARALGMLLVRMGGGRERMDQELKERIEKETNQEVKAKLEAELVRRQEERAKGGGYGIEGWAYMPGGEGAAKEREQEARQQAQLASLAKISMDQAIQIAVSQSPGKVFECSLVGERWEGPGELAKPSRVFYHVVILTGDEAKPTKTHVLVSALDGTIVKADREERRREAFTLTRQPGESRAINGGVLNGKATEIPVPEYPTIARAAHASGAVTVEIMIDEGGNVIAAKAVSGHPLLQAAAVDAARQAIFTPTRLNGEPVRVTGVLVYNFVAQ